MKDENCTNFLNNGQIDCISCFTACADSAKRQLNATFYRAHLEAFIDVINDLDFSSKNRINLENLCLFLESASYFLSVFLMNGYQLNRSQCYLSKIGKWILKHFKNESIRKAEGNKKARSNSLG